MKLFFFLLFILLALASFSAYFTVEPDEKAVVLRLGKYMDTFPPGLHLKLPFGIDQVTRIKSQLLFKEEFGFRTKGSEQKRTKYSKKDYKSESLMLTGDLNVASVSWSIQYNIKSPKDYLFQTKDPTKNIRDVSESVMRTVIGDRSVINVLTVGKLSITDEAKKMIQETLDKYKVGVHIESVALQSVDPPNEVKSSFNEVNSAKQEQEKIINQAREKYNKEIPKARGEAEKEISVAKGFAAFIINKAIGDASYFESILEKYKKYPVVTSERLYMEAMEKILTKVKSFTVIDPKLKGLLPIYGSKLENLLQKESKKQ